MKFSRYGKGMLVYHWMACGHPQENYYYAHFFLVSQTRHSGRETHTLLPWCTNNYRSTVFLKF